MRWRTKGFVPLFICCILIRPSTSSVKSIVSSLDNLEEVDDALQHAQTSLDDLTDLVFEVFTTESTTGTSTSVQTTLDTDTSATESFATMTPTSGEITTSEPDTSSSEPYSPTVPSTTKTEEPRTTIPPITTTETPPKTTSQPPTQAVTTDQNTLSEEPTEDPTDPIETTADPNGTDFDDISISDRFYGENHAIFTSSREMTPLQVLRKMLVKILPRVLRMPKEIDNYAGVAGATTEEPDSSTDLTAENTANTDEVTESETSTSAQETTTEPPTTTPGPWGDRVYSVLGDMMEVTTEISDGQADHEHAYRLDQLATSLDNLVIEGADNTSVLEGMSQEDLDYLNSVKNLTTYTRKDIKKQINQAKDDRQELIVAITLLSVLFVLVLVGLIIAMIRPWASGCRLPGSRKKMRNNVDDSSYISNVSFQDRSQQMRLNERPTDGSEAAV